MPIKKKVKKKLRSLSFQEIIMNLQRFWGKNGCVILQPYDLEVGAGTFHPATIKIFRAKPWSAAYVQPSRRPQMEGMVEIQIDYNIIISIKL